MKKKFVVVYFLLLFCSSLAIAQTYYVDAQNGDDLNIGTSSAPFQSLEYAARQANLQTGNNAIVIRVLPGIYLLEDKVVINPVKIMRDSTRYTIEAAIMPDDEQWSPEKMPVIQSSSDNNSTTQFPHATGMLVAADHVTIRGLKFLGNANPRADYYYPISKEDPSLRDLVVSQCYFIGDKEAAKIQGGVWAHGEGNVISHCVFYECRNGVLFFNNVDGFTIEYSIIYGSYESAFWFGPADYQFRFSNNIVAGNANFLVGPKELKYSSVFSSSVIVDNDGFVGYWSRAEQKVVQISKPDIELDQVTRSGRIILDTNDDVKPGKRHIHLSMNSAGANLGAGIFIKE